MSRYLAHNRAGVSAAGVTTAFSFLALAGCVFVYSLLLRSNAAVFEWGRHFAAQLGWSASVVSQAIPPNRVVVLLESVPTVPGKRKPVPSKMASLPVPEVPKGKPAPETATRAGPSVPVFAEKSEPARRLAAIPAVPDIPASKASPEAPTVISAKKPAKTPAKTPAKEPAKTPVTTADADGKTPVQVAPADSLRERKSGEELAALVPGPEDDIREGKAPAVTEPQAVPSDKAADEPQKPLPFNPAPERDEIARFEYQAKSGVPAAQVALAQRYHAGDGVEKSTLKALYWYHRAAGFGNVDAQFNLGLMYYLGDGVPKDLVSAYRWIALAAQRQDRRAKVVLDGLHRSLPGPVFTALVFPEPIVLGPAPARAAPMQTRAATMHPPSAPMAVTAPQTALTNAALRQNMNMVSYWKPSVFLLGNKPLP
ncbi:MAG: hypothetical protein RIB59_09510 [Rhodospirillales bacterium]